MMRDGNAPAGTERLGGPAARMGLWGNPPCYLAPRRIRSSGTALARARIGLCNSRPSNPRPTAGISRLLGLLQPARRVCAKRVLLECSCGGARGVLS